MFVVVGAARFDLELAALVAKLVVVVVFVVVWAAETLVVLDVVTVL